MRKLLNASLGFLLTCCVLFSFTAPAFASGAANDHTVLILDSTVSGGASSPEALAAISLGMDVEVVDGATWGAKSAGEFGSYRALILGDNSCDSTSIDAAVNNRTTWSPKIDGNIVLIGTDPVYHHAQGGAQLTSSGVAFVVAEPGDTGLYATLSCLFHHAPPLTSVALLDQFGAFTVRGNLACYNDVHIVASHVALSGTTDTTLSNWTCSVHEAFDGFPEGFLPLAIANGVVGSGSITFADSSFGVPYILARGRTLVPVACGDGIVQAGEECDDRNTTNGDGCSAQCKHEICGNNRVDGNEGCDDGNEINGDGCDNNCTVSSCGNGVRAGSEGCDDANVQDGDGCSAECMIEVAGCQSDAECDDEIYCNGIESCDDATCLPGATIDCSSSDGNCRVGECDEDENACVANFADVGASCNDSNACTPDEACNADGVCVGTSGSSCDDGNVCNGVEACDSLLGCVAGSPAADGTSCADEDICNGIETCQSGVCTPGTFPYVGCLGGAGGNGGRLKMNDRDVAIHAGGDVLNWTWRKRAPTPLLDFGDPTIDTAYALCVYDYTAGIPSVAFSARVEPSGTCQDKPCWKKQARRFKYYDRYTNDEGVKQMSLYSNKKNTRLHFRVKGVNAHTLPLPLSQSPHIVVQLANSNGKCWSASYSTPAIRANGKRFVDRAD